MGERATRDSVELAVERWSAWAPGLDDNDKWLEWADGERTVGEESASPDVGFIKPMLRRRMSPLTRMALKVATDCLDGEGASPAYVFCSRYGEYERTFGILNDLANGEPASPMAFSTSVHNTAAGYFSIANHDPSSFTALAGNEATLEAGFVEAWSLLRDAAAEKVLVVYHDQPLPKLYADQPATVPHSVALAFLLCLPKAAGGLPCFRLSWRAAETATTGEDAAGAAPPVLETLRMLLKDGDTVEVDAGRLLWTWSRHDAPG